MPATLSVLAPIPDQVRQPAEQNTKEIGNRIKHVTAAVRQRKMLDQLAYRSVHSKYAECPPGADAHHESRKSRGGKNGNVDQLVKTIDLRPCRGTRGIKHNQLHGQGYAKRPAPQQP